MRQNLELERALDTLETMKRANLVPGLLSYLTVIDMALHLREPSIACDILDEAEKLDTFREKDKVLYMQLLRCAAVEGHVSVMDSVSVRPWYLHAAFSTLLSGLLGKRQ